MNPQKVSIFLLTLCASIFDVLSIITNPEAGLPIEQLVTNRGYPFETHEVTTSDGYILSLHRIKYSPLNNNTNNRPVVLCMHGFTDVSTTFLVEKRENSLACLLADAGFDVWLGNQRGNTYSRKHTTLNPDTQAAQFFDFSWHEIGVYDLKAMIDSILTITSQTQLTYIGHSQGNTAFFVLASQLPEYNNKIKQMYALAPVVFMSNIFSPYMRFYAQNEWLFDWAGTINLYEIVKHNDILAQLLVILCAPDLPTNELCIWFFFITTGGIDYGLVDRTIQSVIFTYYPAGAALKQLHHYIQLVKSCKFRQFDYGATQNLLKYGSSTPPDYPLSKVTCPVHLYYASNDWLSSVIDVQHLINVLPNVASSTLISYEDFNHMDHLYAINISAIYYNSMINQITLGA